MYSTVDEFVHQAYYLSAFYLHTCRSALARRKDIFGLSVRRSMCQPRFAGIRLVRDTKSEKNPMRGTQATQIFESSKKKERVLSETRPERASE
jgi:hypothetical protein